MSQTISFTQENIESIPHHFHTYTHSFSSHLIIISFIHLLILNRGNIEKNMFLTYELFLRNFSNSSYLKLIL